MRILTEDGDDDDDKVKDVPRLLEEVQAQTDEFEDTLGGVVNPRTHSETGEFEDTLGGEDADEGRVDDVQRVLELG